MTFQEALFSLQRQSVERGFGGRLEDIDVTLCEDQRTVSIWAFFYLDEPLMASFDLPAPVTEIDRQMYLDRCEHRDTAVQH
jgi:hypothetical protein